MNRRQEFSMGLVALALLLLTGCLHRAPVTILSPQKVEVPVCAAPPPPREVPEKPDIPLNHLREDMDVADVIVAYRQSVVLLEGWGDALYTVLKEGYQGAAPSRPETDSAQASPPSP
jgi:hypothetical protein